MLEFRIHSIIFIFTMIINKLNLSKKQFKKPILSINNIRILLRNFIFLQLINPMLTEKLSNIHRKLDSIQSVSLKVTNGTKLKIINSNYVPNRIYINGVLSSIDKNGFTRIEKEGLSNVVMEWDKKAEKYSKLFQNIECAIEIDLSNLDISGIQSIKNMFINCKNLK